MRWIGLRTLLVRECRVIARYWGHTLAPPVITTILYFTVFGEIFGQRIGSIDGIEYIRFITPGLIVLWVILYSYGHSAAGFLGARIFKYIEEVLISPQPDWVILIGYVIAGMIRGLLVAIAVLLVAQFFTQLSVHSFVVSAAALSLAALVSALAGFIIGLLSKTFEQVIALQILILTPLTYLGGVFNSISTLPHWAQELTLLNPMFYMVNAFRYGFFGASDVPIGMSLSIVSAFAAALLLAALRLLSSGTGIRE